MTYRLKVYGASKIAAWDWWLKLRGVGTGDQIEWTARWPEVIAERKGIDALSGDASFARRCWITDTQDIRRSDALLLLAPEPTEHLRGGLVEAGYAMACGIPVYLLGNHKDFATWQYHPLVEGRFDTFDQWYELVTTGMYR